jgi:hypothetical protein
MLTLTYKTTRITCTEANAAKYRALIDADKPLKFKKPVDRKHDFMRRDFPVFYAGMETAEYLSRYADLNERLHLSAWDFDATLKRAAPMLDPTEPEVLEEPDSDWAPTATKKKMTPRAALVAIMAATTLEEAQNIAKAAL